MIVTRIGQPTRTVRADQVQSARHTLARRGFFHSETESVDHLRLAPGARLGPAGREGTEELWYVIAGGGRLALPDGSAQALHPGALAVCTQDSGAELQAGPAGLTVVLVAVNPHRLTEPLPTRLPAA